MELVVCSAPNHFGMLQKNKEYYFKYLPISKMVIIGAESGRKMFQADERVEFVDEELSVRSESEAAEFAICCSDDVCGPSSAKFSVFWGDENCVFSALSISPSPKRSHETLSAGKTAWSFSRISFETFLLRPFSICDILGRGMANLSANCETLSPVLSIKMLRR